MNLRLHIVRMHLGNWTTWDEVLYAKYIGIHITAPSVLKSEAVHCKTTLSCYEDLSEYLPRMHQEQWNLFLI